MKKKILYIISHPIQYQSPLIRALNKSKKISVDVMYESNQSTKKYFDHEMNKRIKFDVDLLSGYDYEFASLNGKVSFIKNLKKFIYLIFKKKYDFIWIHGYDNLSKIFIIILSKIFFNKILIRGESSHYSLINKKNKIFIKRIFFRFLNIFTNYFLPIGKSNYRFYKMMNIKDQKLKMLSYIVDNSFFQKKVKKKKKKNKLIFLYASKLIKRKNPELLIKSYVGLPSALKNKSQLLIVGDGILKKDLMKKYKNKNIIFKGFINQNKISYYYNNCDVFVLPSIDENWGLVINEVMNFKKPILCSSVVGCNLDLVKNNFNGNIFKNNDKKDLTKKLKSYFNTKKLIKYGKNSFKIINKWDIDKAVNQFEKVILN